jgi:hypothetical protein
MLSLPEKPEVIFTLMQVAMWTKEPIDKFLVTVTTQFQTPSRIAGSIFPVGWGANVLAFAESSYWIAMVACKSSYCKQGPYPSPI